MAGPRIALVDDHPLFRNALAQVLGAGGVDIIEAGSLDELLPRLDDGLDIDLLLLDLTLPGLGGPLGLLAFRNAYPAIPVVLVSAEDDPFVLSECMLLGASAFVPKSTPAQKIRAAVAAVLAGERWLPEGLQPAGACSARTRELLARLSSLSRRETEVCLMLGKGLLNKQIASGLNISEATVKAHVSRILEKLKVTSRTSAVLVLQELSTRSRPAVATAAALH